MPCSSAPTGSPPTATPPTRSGRIPFRSWPPVTGVPFYICAPISSVDLATADGTGIPIELRSEDEVFHVGTTRIAPRFGKAWNPSFDVTPASLISGIITEEGVLRAPFGPALAAAVAARATRDVEASIPPIEASVPPIEAGDVAVEAADAPVSA